MSFILKGIDIPGKEKTPLNFTIWSDGTVYCRDVTKKITKVQAIQIPKDHGDIIDREDVFTYSQWDEDALNEVTPLLKSED